MTRTDTAVLPETRIRGVVIDGAPRLQAVCNCGWHRAVPVYDLRWLQTLAARHLHYHGGQP